jgi:hypothetical protein
MTSAAQRRGRRSGSWSGPVEGEIVEAVEGLQDVQQVAAGVALVQAEQQAEDLVGGADLEPDQGQQQAAGQVVGVGVAAVVQGEVVGQGAEVAGGQPGQAAEGGGLGGQDVEAQHGEVPQLQAYGNATRRLLRHNPIEFGLVVDTSKRNSNSFSALRKCFNTKPLLHRPLS